jgi:hypothetical protein
LCRREMTREMVGGTPATETQVAADTVKAIAESLASED